MANIGSLIAHLGVDTSGLRSAAQDFKQFETTTSTGLSSMTKGVVALAGAFAGLKVAQFAKDVAMSAARYETLGVVMKVVGNNAGYSGVQMEAFSKSLQKSGIAMTESRSVLTRMTQAQIDLTKSAQLARVAQDAAVIGNINSSEAFERMVYGIQSGQTEVLKTIGLNVNFERSYAKLAAQLGKTAKDLTEFEKTQARVNIVMEAGGRISGAYEASMGTAGKQILSLKRYIDDLKVMAGGAFLAGLAEGTKEFTGALKGAEQAIADNETKMKSWADSIKGGVSSAIKDITFAMDSIKKIYDALPGAVVGAAGIGLVGVMLFGGSGIALVGTIVFLVDQVRALRDVFKEIDEGNIRSMGAFDAIFAKAELLEQARRVKAKQAAETANAVIMAGGYKDPNGRTVPTTGNIDDVFFGGVSGELAASRTIEGMAAAAALDKLAEAALAAKAAGQKLAEQWAKTKRGLEQELKLEGLTGLEKTLQEITNRADELRATAGTDKAWVKQWEEQTKAAATYRDEIEHLGKQYELFAENQVELKRIKEDYDALVIDMLPEEARAVALVAEEYKKKRLIIEEAMASGKASAQDGAAQMALAAQREAEANTKAIDAIRDKSDTIKDIWKNMYQSLQSITADWIYNMKFDFSSLVDLFKKMVSQMVAAWLMGKASMAWGNTSSSPGSIGSGLSAGMGLAAIGGAAAIGSMVSGPNTTGEALTSAGIGTAGIALEAYNSTGGQLSSTLLGSIQDRTAEYVSTNLSAELGAGISDLSGAAFSGWAAGIGTFVISLIRGESFKTAAFKGVGAGLGAWGGFTAGVTYGGTYGSYLGPIGAVVGAAVGALIGGLFAGGGKENTFTLTELVPNMTTAFDKEVGMVPTGWQHQPGGNEWYHGIANAYSDIIGTIQEDFNLNLFAFANQLPETMRGLLLDNLAATDFSAITSEASGGRWGVSGAQGALEGVAQRYADGLAKAVEDAYKAALVTFVSTADPSELLGADLQSTWSVLSDAAQAQVKGMFEAAGVAMQGGLEAGVAEINKVTDIIAQIKAATDPIQEIIDTNGLSEYELAIRAINKEFDDYGAALQAAGVDLSKYTQLEEARTISLANAAENTSKLTKELVAYIDATEDALRVSFDAEKSRLAEQQSDLQDNLQVAEGLLRRSFAAEIESIGNATQTLIDGLNTRLQTSQQTISTLGQAISKLTSAADSMTGAGSRAGILAAISGIQGITGAVKGGDVAALDSVDKYLSIVTGDNAQYYASFDEYQRDFLKAKIAIMDLNAVAGDTLSTEEQMAQMLQTQIDLAQSSADQQIAALNSQLNTLLGIDSSIVGLAQAITEFTTAQTELDTFGYESQIALLDAQLNALLKIDTSVLSLGAATAQYNQAQAAVSVATSTATTDPSKIVGTVADMYTAALGREADPAGLVYWSTQLALAGGNVNAIKDAFFASAEGYGENVTRSFAVGTDYVPYNMTAKIHQGERITPAAYNRSDATNAEIVAELKMLRRENEAIKSELLDIKRSSKRIMDITEKSDAIGPAPARATA